MAISWDAGDAGDSGAVIAASRRAKPLKFGTKRASHHRCVSYEFAAGAADPRPQTRIATSDLAIIANFHRPVAGRALDEIHPVSSRGSVRRRGDLDDARLLRGVYPRAARKARTRGLAMTIACQAPSGAAASRRRGGRGAGIATPGTARKRWPARGGNDTLPRADRREP